MSPDEPDDPTPALGAVVEEGRGSLPFQLIHGESLVACAAWALGDARVTTLTLGTQWAGVVDSGEPFVLHDPLCPMTPAPFISACVTRAVETGSVVVGVADTGNVLSPVVLPAEVVAGLSSLPSLDFEDLVTHLADRFPVERVPAPPSAARVASVGDITALELATGPQASGEDA